MKIDLSLDVERSIAHALSVDMLREDINLVISAISQGHAKGTALHPGLTIDWKVTRDEDIALA